MVMDGYHRIFLFLHQGTHQVVGTLLHLGVRTLYSVQLNAAGVAPCVNGRHASATQSDAVVVASNHHDLVSFLWFFLQTVAFFAVTNAPSQHDNLVVGQLLTVFLMFERQHRTADERLAELVSEVAGTVRGLDEYLFGCLIQPLPHGQDILPRARLAL